MSIQVRRRREAASFLAGFVGAQAELLVDLTNNRVQVHDGATPGGWPAAKLAETQTIGRTAVSDANYAIVTSDVLVSIVALSASRTLTLPPASTYPPGRVLRILDESGLASTSAQIIVAASGADRIEGATSIVLQSAYSSLALVSNAAGQWFKLQDLATTLGGLTALGVNTAADPSNPLSAALNAALFNALYTTYGGSGDVRVKLNKQTPANTASLQFQDAFSGRAEIGLCGDDNFHFKVSPDGSTWCDALDIAASGGAVSLASAPATGDSSARAITSAWFGANLPGGFVNRFRNGAMDVWQRGAGPATVPTSGAYVADGWIVLPSGASCGAQAGAGRALTVNSLQIYGGAGVADVTLKQRIESFIAAPMSGQTITVQAQIYNNTGGAITPALTVKHAAAIDNWSSAATDVSAVALQSCANGAWTRVAYTFVASSSSAAGLEIAFDFGANFASSSKSIELAELDIRATPGVAAGLNGNPPPPEFRPVSTELAFCQRYFATSYTRGIAPGASGQSTAGVMRSPDAAVTYMSFATTRFPVAMRAPPVVTVYNPSTGATGSGFNFNASSSLPVAINDTGDSYFNAFVNNAPVSATNLVGFHYAASAEL
jgi:hypothetical protein